MRVLTRETQADLPESSVALRPLLVGDICFTRDTWAMFVWDGTQWVNVVIGGGMNVGALYTVTGLGPEIPVFGRSGYALQVTGSGGVPTAWDVRLEGSVDGTAWVLLLAHVTGDGNGDVIFSGANRYPVNLIRVNINALTLGPALAINVAVEAVP